MARARVARAGRRAAARSCFACAAQPAAFVLRMCRVTCPRTRPLPGTRPADAGRLLRCLGRCFRRAEPGFAEEQPVRTSAQTPDVSLDKPCVPTGVRGMHMPPVMPAG
jgi:hypothetical protein